MLQNLSFELQLCILEYVDPLALLQCQLVSQAWNRPARILFYRDVTLTDNFQFNRFVYALRDTPSNGLLVKRLTFYWGWEEILPKSKYRQQRMWHYIELITLTPNLESLSGCTIPTSVYSLFICLLQEGQWQRLSHLRDPHHRGYREYQGDDLSSTKPSRWEWYYYILSTMKDWFKTVALNATVLPSLGNELHCFSFAEDITRETRFVNAKSLSCVSFNGINISNLEDILALCPAVNSVWLDTSSFDTDKEGLHKLDPSIHVTKLQLHIDQIDKNSILYFHKKFPSVKQFELLLSYPVANRVTLRHKLQSEEIDMLAKYISRMDKFSLHVTGAQNGEDLHRFFQTYPWRGKKKFEMGDHSSYYVQVNHASFKVVFEKHRQDSTILRIGTDRFSTDFEEKNVNLLKTIDQLIIVDQTYSPPKPDEVYNRLLGRCQSITQLRLEKTRLSEWEMEETPPLITDLVLYDCSYIKKGLCDLSKKMTNLKNLHMWRTNTSRAGDVFRIYMPHTSFQRLFFENSNSCSVVILSIQIKSQENKKKRYYRRSEGRLTEITSKEYDGHVRKKKSACRVELVCKDIKLLEIKLEPNIHFKCEF
ncbi:hypothetical protein A0J61_02257 [Choanephora cucurbitarum]|uniref:F-box domain-containing protein n=1 Tax=Choanephora cucurbitarum TaxID=101091 RepID=A0A1C7NMK5_9FUNG|nr:hypothetical protein A0J61_02257 [Choanephora cucurbitarum]